MKIYNLEDAICLLAKEIKKPILCISGMADALVDNSLEEVLKAVPYLDSNKNFMTIVDGFAAIVCEDEDEQQRLYNLTVGDDGPTLLNSYNGPVKIYALTIDKFGNKRSENT